MQALNNKIFRSSNSMKSLLAATSKLYSTNIKQQNIPEETINTALPPKKPSKLQNMFIADPDSLYVKQDLADGFELGNGNIINGDLIIINNVAFEWKTNIQTCVDTKSGVPSFANDMFKLFDVVSPKPEILVLGTGKKCQPLTKDSRKYLLELGIKVDCSSSRNALGLYNILLDEGRKVALAALSNTR
ncbi:hypothetical protein BB561_006303 [Smittium simulii]|uniref:NADH dehydrogenase [ubiquinone] 1 alpha subcomplex assembly factor 3 n=1 Tax=Smittium simulii TaxID=133385 RepID=A0A2T9Y580_9FUNG|nr:hypothetical protein BB561_006304 [Smittium simulii]PVU87489.1 hypothetical protein BB561_006303 [Smittium simulii]